MNPRLAAAFDLLPEYLGWHVLLSLSALALGLVISLPLAVAASRSARLRWPVLAVASLIQTIPSLALLALFYPLLLALSAASRSLVGAGVPSARMRPDFSTTIRSASSTASAMSCVTMTVVRPSRSCRAR